MQSTILTSYTAVHLQLYAHIFCHAKDNIFIKFYNAKQLYIWKEKISKLE